MKLTEVQRRFIELDKKKAEVKKFLEEYNAAAEAVVAEVGLMQYFQDEEGIVYKTGVPLGTFVFFPRVEILRTRRDGEKAGSMSLKEAKDAGFDVQ